LPSGAIEDTLAIGAELAGCAFIVAGSTIVEIGFDVHADTGAIGEVRRTEAFTG
jgi:hypothetical protein